MIHVIKEVTFPEQNVVQIEFELPQELSARELVDTTRVQITEIIKQNITFGKLVRICGPLTTGMAVVLGHELAYVAKAIEIFDPKENRFYRVIEY